MFHDGDHIMCEWVKDKNHGRGRYAFASGKVEDSRYDMGALLEKNVDVSDLLPSIEKGQCVIISPLVSFTSIVHFRQQAPNNHILDRNSSSRGGRAQN